MQSISTLREEPKRIIIERISHDTFKVKVEYENRNLNFEEFVSDWFNIKFTDVLKLMSIYSKDRNLLLNTD